MVKFKDITKILIAFIIISFILNIVLGMFDFITFVSLFILFIGYLSIYLYLNSKLNPEPEVEDKKSFDYCWRRVNEILSNMPGGDKIEWRGGIDRRSEVRTFYAQGKSKTYRAIYGTLTRKKQPVIVIYSVEDDDIVRYVSNPSVPLLLDPFYQFKPVMGYGLGESLHRDYLRLGRKSRRRIPLYQGDKVIDIDDSYLTSALSNYEDEEGIDNIDDEMVD